MAHLVSALHSTGHSPVASLIIFLASEIPSLEFRPKYQNGNRPEDEKGAIGNRRKGAAAAQEQRNEKNEQRD